MSAKHPKPTLGTRPASAPKTAANAALMQFSDRIHLVADRLEALKGSGLASPQELRELELLLEATHKKFVTAAAAASQHQLRPAR